MNYPTTSQLRHVGGFRTSLAYRGTLTALGLVLSISAVAMTGLAIRQYQSSAGPLPYAEGYVNWVGPNESLDSLLSESELVVIGRITGIESVDVVYPNGYDPNDPSMNEHLGGVSPGVTFTNLRLEVDSYHKGNGPEVLLLRQTGDLRTSNGSLEFPKPKEGERMLVFLTREVGRGENVWASNRGPWGRVLGEDDGLVYAWGDGPRAVPFFTGMTLDEAAALVEEQSKP